MRALAYFLVLAVAAPLAFLVIVMASAARGRSSPPDYDPDDPGTDVDDQLSWRDRGGPR